jgi:hypothetical protein
MSRRFFGNRFRQFCPAVFGVPSVVRVLALHAGARNLIGRSQSATCSAWLSSPACCRLNSRSANAKFSPYTPDVVMKCAFALLLTLSTPLAAEMPHYQQIAYRQGQTGRGEVELPAGEMLAEMFFFSGDFTQALHEFQVSLSAKSGTGSHLIRKYRSIRKQMTASVGCRQGHSQ